MKREIENSVMYNRENRKQKIENIRNYMKGDEAIK